MRVEGVIGDPVAPEADTVPDPEVAVAKPVEPTAAVVLRKRVSISLGRRALANIPNSGRQCTGAGSIIIRRSIDDGVIPSTIRSGNGS